ncbi:MAG: transcription-repair coupling factor [Dehalococcoidales bacterium]|nr:transcription-repair coupling factor [Dehalococcoidales bacterium]
MPPDITRLLSLVSDLPAYRRFEASLRCGEGEVGAVVLDAAQPYFIASLYRSLGRPLFIITAEPEDSKRLYEQLSVWGRATRLDFLPEPEALPYQRIAQDSYIELDRLQVLSSLANIEGSCDYPLVITSVPALMLKTTPYSDFIARCHTIKPGMEVELLSLLRRWQAMGYRMENIVELPGTVSHRGGIVDIYPPSGELPARLEFYGNTVDSIRLFDTASQRSVRMVSSVTIGPATEWLSPSLRGSSELASVLDYLPQDTLIVLNQPPRLKLVAQNLAAKAEKLFTDKLARGELPANLPRPYFTWQELGPRIASRQCLRLAAWGASSKQPRLGFTPVPNYAGQLSTFITRAKQLMKRQHRLIVVSHQASRLAELFNEAGIIVSPITEVRQIPPAGSLTLVQGLLAEGWVMGNTHLFTDYELFGFIKQRRLAKKRPAAYQRLSELTPGDYVVHIEHGIARFAGVAKMSLDNTSKEYLLLKYAADDRLYVPTDQISRISHYIGTGDEPPPLNRLGTQQWQRTKQRAKQAIADIAQELLSLYASREVVPGFAFSADTVWQQELEASFPYVETPDQIKIQQHIKEDMAQPKPMDRLVCGDVGYGKTEMAVRAAFRAVMDGKQVAVLAPTTILAQQHFATFSERMGAFPIRIEVLSRFKTPAEQRAILDGLVKGRVDICIGTHRLLQKDVIFKDLGLLVIDEEQRFGVAHKESLKQKRQEVDVLTLSATPIPRTLHMSLVGVRDMSIMETPPEERLPIKTYVTEADDNLIREAILRELERNGQVFLVHNRVQTISAVAARLQSIVPEARIAIAHGQLPEDKLESVMADFTQGKTDIMVCTTIIESGLDMPNVNTLIVNQADNLGLSQLYQLRGRVGRGTNLAYAYFLYDKGKLLSHIAEKRLRTILEATELGAGFSLAMKDLEIRGAGNLLGVKQSGQIGAVGFNLYCRLLADVVEKQKSQPTARVVAKPELPLPVIDLPLSAYIPEDYVTDLELRLSFYRRLAEVKTAKELTDLASELRDRFGKLPAEVENLLYAIRIKILAVKDGIESISTEHGQIVLRRFPGMRFDQQQLSPFLRDGIKIAPTQVRLNPRRLGDKWQSVLEDILSG